jgi:hypothetical protein
MAWLRKEPMALKDTIVPNTALQRKGACFFCSRERRQITVDVQ